MHMARTWHRAHMHAYACIHAYIHTPTQTEEAAEIKPNLFSSDLASVSEEHSGHAINNQINTLIRGKAKQ